MKGLGHSTIKLKVRKFYDLLGELSEEAENSVNAIPSAQGNINASTMRFQIYHMLSEKYYNLFEEELEEYGE